jgi:uncharacterized protein involved in type VI secretion and phage assembly
LRQRAWRIGFECFVAEGKLYFRKPATNGSATTLAWGDDLVSFRPRMTLAEQVDEVIVKGWDIDKMEAIIGQSKSGNLYPNIGEGKNGPAWARHFGVGKLIIVDQPVVSQAEANTLATARLDELSGAFIEAEGEAFRRPDIQAGKIVKLEKLGKRLSGEYLVTNATHSYSGTGLYTHFTVRGTRTGILAEQMIRQQPLDRWPGVVTAVVTNADDPKNWGRIKVKFPWMTDEAESDWARVIGNGAGPEAGFFNLPEVGDEVLVAFEHGEFGRPYILGGMWNGQHAIPPRPSSANTGEKPLVRVWRSRTGHEIVLHDNADNKVEVTTAGGHLLSFDDAKQKIELKSKGGVTILIDDSQKSLSIKASGDVKIESNANMELKAGANMKIEAGANLDLKANAQATLKGAMVNIN